LPDLDAVPNNLRFINELERPNRLAQGIKN
jgi:hypothetical protein